MYYHSAVCIIIVQSVLNLTGQPYISFLEIAKKWRRNIPSGQIRQVFLSPGGICESPMKLLDG